MERGVLVVSVDLGEGEAPGESAAALAGLLESFRIPATWGCPPGARAALSFPPGHEVVTPRELHALAGGPGGWHARLPGPVFRVVAVLNDLLAVPPPTTPAALPLAVCLEVPAPRGLQALVPDGVRAQRVLWGLDRAVRRRQACHLRLTAAGLEGARLARVLTPGLRMAGRLRDLGEVDLCCLGALASAPQAAAGLAAE